MKQLWQSRRGPPVFRVGRCSPSPCHFQERLALLKVFQNRSVDVTRAEHIHSDAAVPQVVGPSPRKGTYRGFRGAIHAHRGKALDVGDRSIKDDGVSVLH